MRQLQFYKYTTWALLILNLSMIAFFFLTAPPPPHSGETRRKKAVDILSLDKQQNESFIMLARQHMRLMDDFSNQQRVLLTPYFNSLIDQSKIINSDSLLTQIQLLEQKKIESTYQHLKDVKSILRTEQHIYFEEFIEHALERILLEQKKNPLPSKGN